MMGEIFGGYELTQKLGEGGTGETYLALHQETGQKAAVKLLFPQMSANAALVARFFAEVKAASLVNHVGIADLYDCGVHANGRAFLVMEYLEGKTLTDALVELGSVGDIESLADIAWQLATLLAATHAKKILHGGLKPDGIFLTFPPQQAPRPLVKLLDFGMAKFSLSVRHSQTGSLLGAPLYMSPEIGRGLGNVDHRADVYSLGCILFEMACGRPPFVREGKGELIIAHATEPPPSVSSLEPSVPQAIDTLIGRMLTKNPAARPQSMTEVAAVLEKFFKCPMPAASQALIAAPPLSLPPPVAVPAPFAAGPLLPAYEAAPVAIPESKPLPRRQDATALLPPSAQELVPSQTPFQAKPAGQQAWLARVHQRTAILSPPSTDNQRVQARTAERPSAPTVKRRRPAPGSSPPPARRRAPTAFSLSLPIIIISASVVLASVALGYLLWGKKRLPPAATSAKPVSTASPAPSRFQAPQDVVPRADLAKPFSPPSTGLLQPVVGSARPTDRASTDRRRPQNAPKPGLSGAATSSTRDTAKRW
jgi:serine/threonine protein kinase